MALSSSTKAPVALVVVRGHDQATEHVLEVLDVVHLCRVPYYCQSLRSFFSALPFDSDDRTRLKTVERSLLVDGWKPALLFVLPYVCLTQPHPAIRVHTLFPEDDLICRFIEFAALGLKKEISDSAR